MGRRVITIKNGTLIINVNCIRRSIKAIQDSFKPRPI